MDNGPKRVAPRRSNPLSKPATDVVEFQRDSIPRISGFTITRVFHVHSSHWIGTDFSFGCFGVALISRWRRARFSKVSGAVCSSCKFEKACRQSPHRAKGRRCSDCWSALTYCIATDLDWCLQKEANQKAAVLFARQRRPGRSVLRLWLCRSGSASVPL